MKSREVYLVRQRQLELASVSCFWATHLKTMALEDPMMEGIRAMGSLEAVTQDCWRGAIVGKDEDEGNERC